MNKGASPVHSRLFGIRLATSAVFETKFAQFNDDVLFGEVWAREEQLPLPDRRIVTVVALMAQGLADSSFRYHLETAKKGGVTGEEMAEILDPCGVKTGPAPPKPGRLSRCQRSERSNSRFLKQVNGTFLHTIAHRMGWRLTWPGLGPGRICPPPAVVPSRVYSL